MHIVKHLMPAGSIAVLVLAATPAMAATVFVTNNGDDVLDPPAGSFRAAVEAASMDASVTSIRFRGDLGTIELQDTVIYSGPQSLSIDGRGTEVSSIATGNFDLFEANGGADLTFRNLAFSNGGGNGITVEVPGNAEGNLSVSLFDVTVESNSRYGLLIEDQVDDSSASIWLDVLFSRFLGNGLEIGIGDLDGVRVNEGGDGDIVASVHHSEFNGNGADGFELDEDDAGDVTLKALHSSFDENGQNPADTDDGMDIDEDADGSIWVQVAHSTFNGHTDDGIGLDETGNGDIHLSLVQVETSDNGDSGVSADEGDAGNFEIKLVQVLADGNDEEGLNLSEVGGGDFVGSAVGSSFSGNGEVGIAVEQLDDGSGVLRLVNVVLEGNGVAIELNGVDVTGPGF